MPIPPPTLLAAGAIAVSLLLPRASAQTCNEIQITFEASRDITFPRDLSLTLQPDEANGRSVCSNGDYSLAWKERQQLDCIAVGVSGCEDVQSAAMTTFALQSELCDERPLYKSSNDLFLYYDTL